MGPSPVQGALSGMRGVGEGSRAQFEEVKQKQVRMNRRPTRRRLNLFSQILPAPLHQRFCSLCVLEDKVEKSLHLCSWLMALRLTTSEATK